MKRRGKDYRDAELVRALRSRITHLTDNYRQTWCARSCDGWTPVDHDWPTCSQCRRELDAMLADRN